MFFSYFLVPIFHLLLTSPEKFLFLVFVCIIYMDVNTKTLTRKEKSIFYPHCIFGDQYEELALSDNPSFRKV